MLPDYHPGLLLLPPSAAPAKGSLIKRFPLADDTSGATARYEWTYKQGAESTAEIGVTAFGSRMSLKTHNHVEAEIKLAYELRGGHDYELFKTSEGEGLLWNVQVALRKT